MTTNQTLHKARAVKDDEFYTRLEDIENELKHHKRHFNDKIVCCNCDNPKKSAFWKYFHINFARLGLRELISTYYNHGQPACKMVYGGSDADIETGIERHCSGTETSEVPNVSKF